MSESDADPCPFTPVIDLILGRWTAPILWELRQRGPLRFTELQRLMPSITPKVLTQRLRQLERDGLVTRSYHAEVPPRVEYDRTALAESLTPVFDMLVTWSEGHLEEVAAARLRYDEQTSARTRPL
ncbi:winged helix-turn-helix transcriptional regulator [Thermomonospora umbrina]|uniref:HxlR family transcriptional regulator n=1 Tax=Thermomonospora umbrina TaxID=111806 RepID=A0A3D9SZE5_9ACTN|nr:helix-turn-helix domain-containing protein [Thermomonospora umbrina]REF00958.1 HxlR family transcriptional regulator [Thermomonospora umbrina]